MPKPLMDSEEIAKAIHLLFEPGAVFEVRVLDGIMRGERLPATYAGYFDSSETAINALQAIESAMGVYVTLQVCKKELIRRCKNHLKRLRQHDTVSASDKDIKRYRWLLIDSDINRDVKGISSTDYEHAIALEHSLTIQEELTKRGWPDPIRADSGNGGHLLYRIDLPNNQESSALLKGGLEQLGKLFDTEEINIDASVFNPSRIDKLYGTRACKGDDVEESPHRLSRILAIPQDLQDVTEAQLKQLLPPGDEPKKEHTKQQPKEKQKRTTKKKKESKFSLRDFIKTFNIEVSHEDDYEIDGQKARRFHLTHCYWDKSHTDHAACLYEFEDGKLGASCSHNSCKGKGWSDFKEVFVEKDQEDASQFDTLLMICQSVPYFKTPEGALVALVPMGKKEEIVTIGPAFQKWLRKRFFDIEAYLPQVTLLTQITELFEQMALESGQVREIYTRVACQDNVIYLDLANEKRECVMITSEGWEIITQPPVLFRRPAGLLPLPRPAREGMLEELRNFVHVRDEDWPLIVGFELMQLHPSGPYPVLVLCGEEGSTKSYGTCSLRNLTDPHAPPTRSIPKDVRDFAIAAQSNWCLALENLSYMPDWLSDALCRLATGSGYGTRRLWTDEDEKLFSTKRPCIVNGIPMLVKNSDLLSRSIVVTMPRLDPKEYRGERELNNLYAEAHARMLGGLLDVVVVALQNLPTVVLTEKTRMIDLLEWTEAAAPALGWERGEFTQRYLESRREHMNEIIGGSMVAEAVVAFVALSIIKAGETKWEGTYKDFDAKLIGALGSKYNEKKWPPDSTRLSNALTRLGPALRDQGIEVTKFKETTGEKRRMIRVTYAKPEPPKEEPPKKEHDSSDASDASDASGPGASVTEQDKAASGFTERGNASDASDSGFNTFQSENTDNISVFLYPTSQNGSTSEVTDSNETGIQKNNGHDISAFLYSDKPNGLEYRSTEIQGNANPDTFLYSDGQNGSTSHSLDTNTEIQRENANIAESLKPLSLASPAFLVEDDMASEATLHGDATGKSVSVTSVTSVTKNEPVVVDVSPYRLQAFPEDMHVADIRLWNRIVAHVKQREAATPGKPYSIESFYAMFPNPNWDGPSYSKPTVCKTWQNYLSSVQALLTSDESTNKVRGRTHILRALEGGQSPAPVVTTQDDEDDTIEEEDTEEEVFL